MALTIADFQKGDTVYHLSNAKVVMVVVDTTINPDQVKCRWIDNKGQIQLVDFFPQELGKASDLLPKFFSI